MCAFARRRSGPPTLPPQQRAEPPRTPKAPFRPLQRQQEESRHPSTPFAQAA